MKKMKFIVLGILTIICFSCGSGILVSNVTELKKNEISSVKLISAKEKLDINGLKIADIVLKENTTVAWNFLKNKLIETAKSNGANVIVVDNIGFNLKGYGFYLEGKLYYVETPFKEIEENCELGFVRDRFESVLGSAFSINLKVEGQDLGELKKEKSLLYVAKNCSDKLTFFVNKKEKQIVLNGKSKYFQIGKQTAGNSNGGGIQIGIGGLSVVEIQDEELGKLLYQQNK